MKAYTWKELIALSNAVSVEEAKVKRAMLEEEQARKALHLVLTDISLGIAKVDESKD